MGKNSSGSSKDDKTKEMDARILKVMLMYHEEEKCNVRVDDVANDLDVHVRHKFFRDRWGFLKNSRNLIGMSKSGEGLELTKVGLDEAATPEYKARMLELAITPKTNSEHQERIKKHFKKPKSMVIFDFLLKFGSLSKDELSPLVGQNKRSHGFHYAFNELQNRGYVEVDPGYSDKKAKKFRLADKAFKSKADRPKEGDIGTGELAKEISFGFALIESRKCGLKSSNKKIKKEKSVKKECGVKTE